MRRPYSVQVFLVQWVDHQFRYLLFHRKARPELGLPEFWQGISGALESGESFIDAAFREVVEETGFTLDSLSDTGFQHSYAIRPEWRKHYGLEPTKVIERIFVALLAVSLEPVLSSEHQSWRWCSQAEAESLLTFGGNAQCIQAVEGYLRQQPTQPLKATLCIRSDTNQNASSEAT